jgi:hypothetical protein
MENQKENIKLNVAEVKEQQKTETKINQTISELEIQKEQVLKDLKEFILKYSSNKFVVLDEINKRKEKIRETQNLDTYFFQEINKIFYSVFKNINKKAVNFDIDTDELKQKVRGNKNYSFRLSEYLGEIYYHNGRSSKLYSQDLFNFICNYDLTPHIMGERLSVKNAKINTYKKFREILLKSGLNFEYVINTETKDVRNYFENDDKKFKRKINIKISDFPKYDLTESRYGEKKYKIIGFLDNQKITEIEIDDDELILYENENEVLKFKLTTDLYDDESESDIEFNFNFSNITDYVNNEIKRILKDEIITLLKEKEKYVTDYNNKKQNVIDELNAEFSSVLVLQKI